MLQLDSDVTTTPQVVDVEQESTTTAPTSLPTLSAPKVQILGDWHDVKDHLIDNLVKSHMYYRLQGGIPHSGNLLQHLQRVAITSCYNKQERATTQKARKNYNQ